MVVVIPLAIVIVSETLPVSIELKVKVNVGCIVKVKLLSSKYQNKFVEKQF